MTLWNDIGDEIVNFMEQIRMLHSHLRVIAGGTLAVGDDAGERLPALARGHACHGEHDRTQTRHHPPLP